MTMKKSWILPFNIFWIIVMWAGCIEPYTPPEIEDDPDLLVVDGFLDGTKKECIVSISRTQKLGSSDPPRIEYGALVSLQEKGGSTVFLVDNLNGTYSQSNLSVSAQKEYKINVTTADGKEYTSEYVVLKPSPPIDSVTWEANDQGVQIQATTHDDSKGSRYYQWKFTETWEYSAAYYSNMIFENGSVSMRSDDIYTCWQENTSTNIIIGSTDKLTEDVIYKYPITLLPKGSEKYLTRYSILVQQRVLSKEAYNYWSELQRNTENLGTLFDPQPSQITGNIVSTQNAADAVLGYFTASFTSEKRIFIRYAELPPGFPYNRQFPGCKMDTVLLENLPDFGSTGKLLTVPITIGGVIIIGYGNSTVDCVDCRSKGGTNVEPDFW